MTTIFYETLPVAQLTLGGEWRLEYDPAWKARRSAFPVSLTMPLRSGSVSADRLLPWLANLLPETHIVEIGQWLKVSGLPQCRNCPAGPHHRKGPRLQHHGHC